MLLPYQYYFPAVPYSKVFVHMLGDFFMTLLV